LSLPQQWLLISSLCFTVFKAFKFAESSKEIIKKVEGLSRHLKAYEEYFSKVGNSLGTTVNHYNAAQKELGKVDKDVAKLTESR
jgi:DNA recombination protein RmuC